MKTVLYLIRHGQSMANLLGKFVGHTDYPLSSLGEKQAELTADYFKNINIDFVYSSDLSRAFCTAKAIADVKGISVIKSKSLREMHCGIFEDTFYDDFIIKHSADFDIWENDIWNFEFMQGESTKQLYRRANAEITRIAQKHKGKTVCIGTHAMFIRTFCGSFLTKDMKELSDVPTPSNASVTKLEYENGKFELLTYSYDSHLKDLVTKFS